MTLKTIATGSTGNCYILTSDNGKHLILDAGIPIGEIKRGLKFDVENVIGAIVTHGHTDHCQSVPKLKAMGVPVWLPCQNVKHKRQRTHMSDFVIECFDVPHNGTENRAFIITCDNVNILYATDYEFIPYDLSKRNIEVALVEMNYQRDRVDGSTHLTHTVLGHAEEQTVIELLSTLKDTLRVVVFCHMSMSGGLNRELAYKHAQQALPDHIDIRWARNDEIVNISRIPF